MIVFQTILIYSILAIVMYAFSKKAYITQNTLYQIIPIIAFILVFGLRYSVGIDWENYRSIYEEGLHGMSFLEMLETRYEIGFIIIVYLCQYLQLPTYMLFVSFSAIQIVLLYKAFKDEEALPFIYLAFILSGIAIHGFCNVIRQDIAFCIFLYALKYAKEHRLIPYFLLCGLAMCFHKSAFILFPIYFLWIKKSNVFNNSLIQIAVFLGCIIASLSNPVQHILSYVENLIILLGFERYTDSVIELTTNKVIGPTRITLILAHVFIILNNKNMKSYYNSDLFNRLYDLYFIGICFYFFFIGNMMFGRITLYFTNYIFIIFGYALYYYIKTSKIKLTIIGLLTLSLALFTSYANLLIKCTTNTDAYVSYFQKDLHSIKDRYRATLMENR